MTDIKIVDDGTLDTVVKYDGQEYRYSSEFRYSFDDDDAFLREALDDIQEEIRIENSPYGGMPMDNTNQDLHDLLVILIVGMDKFRMSNTKYRYLVDLILNHGWTVRRAIKRIETDDANESWHHYYPKGH